MQSSEPVVLVPYSESWPRTFAMEAQLLRAALSGCELVAVEHVGSTAIPGMTAKPVIDILAGVADMRCVPSRRDPLWAALGYAWGHGDEDDGDWHYYIKRDASGHRLVHLHVVPYGEGFWRRTIVFRDALRADPEKAREYEALKLRLAATVGHDRLQYLEGKSAFVAAVVER